MKSNYFLFKIYFLGVVGCFNSYQEAFAQQKQFSNWIGNVVMNDTVLYAKLNIRGDSGRIIIPQRGLILTDFKSFHLNDRLTFRAGEGKINFNGHCNTDSLWGTINVNGTNGKLHVKPYAPLRENDVAELEGMYKLVSGQLISATPFSDGIEFLNYSSGEYIKCWQSARSQGQFFQVLPLQQNFKKNAAVLSVVKISNKNLAITKYDYSGNITKVSKGKKVTLFTEKKLFFENDTIAISGLLKTPDVVPKKVPLVIIIPGSGDFLTTTLYSKIINFFAANGMAVFSYDKRGMGESTGDFNTADFYDFTTDILAVIKGLSKESSIDSTRIILWGHSQGGWIAPMVANRCKNIAGIISVSGPTDTPGVQTTYWVENFLKTMNYSDKEVAEAVEWMHLITKVMDAHGEGYERIEARLPEIQTKKWQDFVTVPESKDNLLSWGGYYYDPIVELKKLETPMLAIFGGLDINVNAETNSKKLNQLFRASHNLKSKVMVFSNADHDIVLTKTGNRDLEERYQGFYAPMYFESMKNWINSMMIK
jgi:uncharacterized protein